MNTNPDAIKVLCFGDSNTWGQNPDRDAGRYPSDVRWTGLLQKKLGGTYYVVEEGLGGRTTDLERADKPGRNGLTYFLPCIQSHASIDILVIMLGTNDIKIEFNRSTEQIVGALQKYFKVVKEVFSGGDVPTIVTVSPALIDHTAPRFEEYYKGIYDEEATAKSKQLSSLLKLLAERNNSVYVDAAETAEPGADGIHWKVESQEPFAEALSTTIKSL